MRRGALLFSSATAALGLALLLGTPSPTVAQNYVVKDGNGTLQTFCSVVVLSVNYSCSYIMGSNGGTPTALDVDSSGRLILGASAGINIGTVALSGTLPAFAATPTVNLGTLNGAALDASVNGLQVSQATATSGAKGHLTFGAVTAAAPTYVDGTLNSVSLTLTGALRVDGSAVTQPISGNVGISGTLPGFASTPTFNCGTGCAAAPAFIPTGNASLAVNTTTGRVALPTSDTNVVVQNTGLNTAYIKFGNSAVAATTSDTPLIPGQTVLFGAGGASVFLAGITATGTDTLLITNGTGVPVFGNSTDQSQPVPVTTNYEAAAGAALPTKLAVIAGEGSGNATAIPVGDQTTLPINISTATTTKLITNTTGKKTFVVAWDVMAGGTGNFTWEYGTGANCGTGTTTLTGAYPLTAQSGIARGTGVGGVLVVPASQDVCVLTSAAVQMSGSYTYTQY